MHLSVWPTAGKYEKSILDGMEIVREFCASGNMGRKKLGIPIRQPLETFFIPTTMSEEYKNIIKEELNVKNIEKSVEKGGVNIYFDENITSELKAEGNYRELIRAVQDMRKAAGLAPSDMVKITISPDAESFLNSFLDDFKKTVQAKEVIFAENQGVETKIDEMNLKISIEK